MSLHTPTLLAVIVFAAVAMAASLGFLARGAQRDLRDWALALTLLACAYGLMALRGRIPDLLSVLVANMSLSGSLALFAEGLLRFQRSSQPRWLTWWPVPAVGLMCLVFDDDFRARVVVGGILFLWQALYLSSLLFKRLKQTPGRGQYILLGATGLISLVVTLRVLATATGAVEMQGISDSNPVQAGTFLVSLLAVLMFGIGVVMMVHEHTARALQDSERHYRQLVESSNEGICVIQDGRLRFVSPRLTKMLGFSEAELVGRDFLSLVHPDDRGLTIGHCQKRLADQGDDQRYESRALARGEEVRWVEISGKRIDWQGTVASLNFVNDVTERRARDEEIRELAYHDTLTRLPNRRLLLDHLQQALAANKRSGKHGALIFMDLDRFKLLNDAHGHQMGDLLLIEVAQRLRRSLRDMDTVARFGGDEFVVLLNELSDDPQLARQHVESVATKLLATLSEPYRLRATQDDEAPVIDHRCTASLGIALFRDGEDRADSLLDQADAAMYEAKSAGRNRFQFAVATPDPEPPEAQGVRST